MLKNEMINQSKTKNSIFKLLETQIGCYETVQIPRLYKYRKKCK